MREARRDEPTETFGSYLLYECLGRGGMATVHRAKKTGIEGFERPVALKRMLPWLTSDPDYVKSFVREARLAAQLRHTNIAQTYDLGRVDDVYFIAMELVAGRDLREILRQGHNVVGPLPVPVVVNLLFQICDALEYAHTFRDDQGRALGLVHRDISPANIIVADDGTAKVVDFGVAKGSTATLATASGMLKGKFAYMAPEMIQGQVDARCDLFAVGVVAWEMLTAKPLFSGGDDMEILQRVTGWDPPAPSTINPSCPRELDAWVAMALTKQPQRRFQSAAQMRAGLELVARTKAMRASPQDVSGWVAWAFQQQPASRRRPSSPAPVGAPQVTQPTPEPRSGGLLQSPSGSGSGTMPTAGVARPGTIVVEEAAIEGEAPRHSTAVGMPSPSPTPVPRVPSPSSPPPARTLLVDEAAVVSAQAIGELPRHHTAIGTAPIPNRTPQGLPIARPQTGQQPIARPPTGQQAVARPPTGQHAAQPQPYAAQPQPQPYAAQPQPYAAPPQAYAPQPYATLQNAAVPAPIHIPPSSGVPQPVAASPSQGLFAPSGTVPPAAQAAAAARTVLLDQTSDAVPQVTPTAPSSSHAYPTAGYPGAQPMPTQHMQVAPPTQHMQVAPPTQMMQQPTPQSMAPTIAPDHQMMSPYAGYLPNAVVSTQPMPQTWGAAPPQQVALHGENLSAKPEYIAATAAFHTGDSVLNESPPPFARGTPRPQPVAQARAETLPPRKGSGAGLAIVLILCAAAAVGGFFLVQHFL